jgi:hypothetical protein
VARDGRHHGRSLTPTDDSPITLEAGLRVQAGFFRVPICPLNPYPSPPMKLRILSVIHCAQADHARIHYPDANRAPLRRLLSVPLSPTVAAADAATELAKTRLAGSPVIR